MKKIKTVYDDIFKFVNISTITFAVCMVSIMAINVFMRYVLNNALRWGDEMAQFFMIWLGLMSASLAMKEDRHIRLHFWEAVLPPKYLKVLEVTIHILVCIVLVVLMKLGIDLVILTGNAKMSGSRLPLALLYSSLPVSCAFMLIGAIGRSCEIIGRP